MPASNQAFRPQLAIVLATCLLLSACAGGKGLPRMGLGYPVSVTWNDTRWCVPLRLKIVLRKVSRRFGPVTVHSSHRWPLENWRKGGKPRSYHLSCKAVDFSVKNDPGGVLAYLRSLPQIGGHSRYPQGFYHIDTGPRRSW